MLEIGYDKKNLCIKWSGNTTITFNIDDSSVLLDGLDINFSGEYEKSWILVEVKKYVGNLYFNFLVDWKRLVIISHDSFELKEEILSFFGDVDILLIVWTKQAAKLFESIEAKLVIPYGEGKDIFLNTLWQKVEEVKSYKVKWEFSLDSTEFVNLK